MTAALAAKELQGGTGKTWAEETDYRLRQALGRGWQDTRLTTNQMWNELLFQKGYKYGTFADKIALWQKVKGTNYSATYAALSLPRFSR